MHQPGAVQCRPELWSGVCWESRLLIFLALFLLLLPCLHGRLHPPRGEVLMTRRERWLLCGTVALDPKDFKWSCCRDFYPFHRPTQRCCQAWDKFIVIPMDPRKSEAEDCRTYTQETLVTGKPVRRPVCILA